LQNGHEEIIYQSAQSWNRMHGALSLQ